MIARIKSLSFTTEFLTIFLRKRKFDYKLNTFIFAFSSNSSFV